jgi:uncharacterized 2Fe-2S/4Fe-4S cluster protein (DUF4445 family)
MRGFLQGAVLRLQFGVNALHHSEAVCVWRKNLVVNEPRGDSVAVRLAKGRGNRDIVISEVDIARLLQAKAAIAAGILTLVSQEGL